MKIALNSYSGYGSWFALRLLADGHDVTYHLSNEKYTKILSGLVKPKILDLDNRRTEKGFPDYEKFDLSIFDLTGRKQQADCSHLCCPTIGDGSIHCQLENDRVFGIKLMEQCKINVPPYEEFSDLGAARNYIKSSGKRYVYKPNGGQDQGAETTYVSKSAEDMLEYLDKIYSLSKGAPFILQEFIKGIECSVEGWFNGDDFYCINATIEEKKFMNENIGPNTGCAGNLVFLLNSKARIFREGLYKAKEILHEMGFRGMIDLNTILTESEIYGLEWTPRFGYDASATLACMYSGDYGDLLYKTAAGEIPDESFRAAFGVSTRITIPPYPTEIKIPSHDGIPIEGIDPEDVEQIMKTYLYDVRVEKNKLVTNGITGLICCPIEIASEPEDAYAQLKKSIERIHIPDAQYRTDIEKSTMKRYMEVKRMGWLDNE
jgi:phosphoribosylamine--glycine ligase